MSSEAKATGTEGLGFDGDVEAAERALKTRGVQDNEGAALEQATGLEVLSTKCGKSS